MPQTVLTKTNKTAASPLSPVLPEGPGETLNWSRLYGSSRGLAIAEAARQARGPLLIILPDVHNREQLQDEIRFYLGADQAIPVLAFSDWECLPYDVFSPLQDIISQRLSILYQLPSLTRGIVLATASTLMQRLAPREFVAGHSLMLNVSETLDLGRLKQELQHAVYQNVSQVMEPGEYAVRGGLIDLFPMGSRIPYRIDLFDDRIESIREFDPQNQRSGATLGGVQLLPAREFPMTPNGIRHFRQAYRARFEGDPQKAMIYREVSNGHCPAGIEYYLPLFFDHTATIFDYLPASTLCVFEEGLNQAMQTFQREVNERYELLQYDRERPVLSPAELFLTDAEITNGLQNYQSIQLLHFKDDEDVKSQVSTEQGLNSTTVIYDTRVPPDLSVNSKSESPYAAFIDHLHRYPGRILLVAETAGRRETLRALLEDNGFYPAAVPNWHDFLAGEVKLALTVVDLDKGLSLQQPNIAIITEQQLYGERASQKRRRDRRWREPADIIKSLAELHIGDPVVHEDHGVGRYLGLQILDVGDGPTEFLTLEYASGDKLYIPVVSLHLICRYTGTHPESVPLHRLGSDAWEKAKQRAQKKAFDTAVELLEIQALRAARKGHQFKARDEQYMALAEAFPFEETPDQERAITEVLEDMESEKSMDRLVCGDVGFGKTEVAMRAAFLAVHGQKQVVVLAPTTLLAQQHYQNFQDRFADLPVTIALLSRFRSKQEQAKTLTRLIDGSIDLVIGTHRILQDDVRFKRLGLIIIDEEHRFGVRQKERLKKLRSEVDILTLTATPIPRTLNMALAGLRDISIIATPPEERLAVKTFVLEWNKAVIREACVREIRRGGQVYFLHNEVKTIDTAARHLQELLPEAEIRIAHGKMPERELEHTMLDFYHQRFNILVCSTIIESGIDVPSANTIIIHRADKFGLAQLHQLRGRVGRSRRRAYAYLLVPPRNLITEDARKRLEAIEALDELGAGFTLASHDLEIRGAGELLGEAQSGEIDEVGFSLYAELLERAVTSLREGRTPDLTASGHSGTEINLHAAALLPENYLPDVHMRLILYKRIANAKDLEQLNDLKEEVIDRFGLLPEPGKLLFTATELKIKASPLGIYKIDAGNRGVRIQFQEKPNIDPATVMRLIQSSPETYKFDGPHRLRVLGDMKDVVQRVRVVRSFLDELILSNH